MPLKKEITLFLKSKNQQKLVLEVVVKN